MECPDCRQSNPPAARFCNGCGRRLVVACPGCRAPNAPGSRFCGACGLSLPPEEGAAGHRFGPPVRYTPPHLLKRILTSRLAVEGERKQVTVLFADLKGSLELLADRDPEDARALLDSVLERMMDAVHLYEGTVNQVLGDGVMALFGAPLAHEDHAVRACYAALRIQQSVERYAEELRRRQGIDLLVRVGVNSGEVVVRSISSDLHLDYTAVGQTTHLAARMEQLARPGTILVTGATARLVAGYVDLRPLGSAPVKGVAEPVELFEVVGRGPVRSRLDAAAARGLTRLVGREAELQAVHRVVERVAGGHGQVVGITGEPGVGKSRLVWELIHSPRMAGWLTLEGSGVPYGKATPYLPVLALLRAYFQIGEADDERRIREKVSGTLLGLDEGFGALLPPLLTLLDVPVEDPKWLALDPGQRRRRTLDAVRRLLLRQSAVQPVCLVVDDLHWIDAETQAVLDGLVEGLPAARLLLLLCYRTDHQHEWSGRSYYEQIRIDPLSRAGAEELLRGLLGDAGELAELRNLLIERTEGNPFFLEESVWNLVETGALVGARGAYRLGAVPPASRVPASVQAVLAARIDRLAVEDKQLLQAASVIGKHVPLVLLQAISGLHDEPLRDALARLQAGELLYELSLSPQPEYTFKHVLTQEVAYGTLLRERRRKLDEALVDALERLYPDRQGEALQRLAHHAVRGELWAKAVRYCREAGAHAFARSAHRGAVASFEQALEALKQLPQSQETVEQAVDIRLDLRYALTPLGDYGRVLDHLREAERLAEGLEDRRRLGLVSSFLANFFTVMLDLGRAIEYGRRAVEIATGVGDLPLRVVSTTFLALACHGLGDYRHAIELARRNAETLTGPLARDRFGMALVPSVYSRTVLVWSLAELGEFAEAIAVGNEALAIAEGVDHAYSLIFGHMGLAMANLRRGEFDTTVRLLERALGLCRSGDVPVAVSFVAAPLGSAYARSGRVDEAFGLLKGSIEHAIAIGDPYGHWLRTAGMAEAYLMAGQAEKGLALARRAVEFARYAGFRGSEAWAWRLVGDLGARHAPEEGEAAYGEALRAATALGMRPLEAHCRLGLGALAWRSGRPDEGRADLLRALDMFREMGMSFWVAQAERELNSPAA